jgi:LemA protein
MKTSNIVLLSILGLFVILFFWGCGGYNNLVSKDETVKQMTANIQSAYQRRADLIPNLVNTVKGEANFEKSTLEAVVQARASATQIKLDANDLTPAKMQAYQQAQGQLSQSLGRLLAVAENYPNLQTNQAFQGLQAQLEGTENRIKVSRDDFNKAVQDYNVSVRSFPVAIFAGMWGFHVQEGFQADAGTQNAPTVNFGN